MTKQANRFVESEAVVAAIRLRLSSKTRFQQILALSVGDEHVYHGLHQALNRNLVTLNQPLVSAHVDGCVLTFVGTEEEVLAKVRAVPLPREGKKGTSRTTLVKMVVSRIERLQAGSRPLGWKMTEENVLMLVEVLVGAISSDRHDDSGMRSAANKFVGATGMKGQFEGWNRWSYNDWESMCGFFIREDVTPEILREGIAVWTAKLVMEA
jgi:hypothetical protein